MNLDLMDDYVHVKVARKERHRLELALEAKEGVIRQQEAKMEVLRQEIASLQVEVGQVAKRTRYSVREVEAPPEEVGAEMARLRQVRHEAELEAARLREVVWEFEAALEAECEGRRSQLVWQAREAALERKVMRLEALLQDSTIGAPPATMTA